MSDQGSLRPNTHRTWKKNILFCLPAGLDNNCCSIDAMLNGSLSGEGIYTPGNQIRRRLRNKSHPPSIPEESEAYDRDHAPHPEAGSSSSVWLPHKPSPCGDHLSSSMATYSHQTLDIQSQADAKGWVCSITLKPDRTTVKLESAKKCHTGKHIRRAILRIGCTCDPPIATPPVASIVSPPPPWRTTALRKRTLLPIHFVA